MNSSTLMLAAFGVWMILPGGAALAQTPDTRPVLEEILVTSQRREEDLQQVPIAVTAFSVDEINNRGSIRLQDLEFAVPNVAFGPRAGNAFTVINIRGIGGGALDQSIGTEATVGVYVDGVYLGRRMAFNSDLANVERVEFLRGPQGTLFGKNTIAGAINIVTRQPGKQFEGVAEIGGGRFDEKRAELYLAGPIGSSGLRGGISAFGLENDGYTRNILSNTITDDEGRVSVRGVMAYEPSEKLRLSLAADYLREEREINLGEAIGPGAEATGQGAPFVVNKTPGANDRTIWGSSFTAEWSLSGDMRLTSITALRSNKLYNATDDDALPFQIFYTFQDHREEQWTEELRLTSATGRRLSYVLGAFFNYDTVNDYTFSWILPDIGIPGTPARVSNEGTKVEARGGALYADLSYALTPALTLKTGGRVTREEKQLELQQQGFAPIDFATIPFFEHEISDTAFTPRLVLQYQATEGTMLYATASGGFKSGGYNVVYVPSTDAIQFDPERVTSFEIGSKSEFNDGRVRLNLAAFYMNYDDIQVSQVLALAPVASNAGRATSKGVEVDAAAVPFDGWQLSTAVGYNIAEYDDFKDCGGPGIHCDGNTLQNAPKWTVNAATQNRLFQTDALRLYARAEYSYRAETFQEPGNAASSYTPSYGLWNGRIWAESADGDWQLAAWIRNATDERYSAGNINFILDRSTFGSPRTYGVDLRHHF